MLHSDQWKQKMPVEEVLQSNFTREVPLYMYPA